jgi:hypothetical protein
MMATGGRQMVNRSADVKALVKAVKAICRVYAVTRTHGHEIPESHLELADRIIEAERITRRLVVDGDE